jgi:hypothetical protein
LTPSFQTGAPDNPPKAELLRSLGRLVRGLSTLFWSLPLSLIICFQTAKTDTFRSFNVLPPVIVTGLLLYGLGLLGHFQKQERVWISALDRAKQIAFVNFGLSPFLYWYNARPGETFYLIVVGVLALTGLAFLYTLNAVLHRLSAMLPDEALRLETSQFTAMNRRIISAIVISGTGYLILLHLPIPMPVFIEPLLAYYGPSVLWMLLFMTLLPLAMTMSLIWKIKEVILESVFGGGL